MVRLFGRLYVVLLLLQSTVDASKNLEDLEYRVYPRRTPEEATVLEWGHSAIISALDASVAFFGPQTSQAALLEVECQPVLASPLNGVKEGQAVSPLDNAADVLGNMVVMTNTGNLTGVNMAKIAMASGAAALLVVNIDEVHPDDIYRLESEPGSDEVDIPVVMISLNSANVLTTATVLPNMDQADIINNGMPDRVRLYAGGDRPFFEDVEPVDPTLYLIHNLLTEEECDSLVKAASRKMEAVSKDCVLEHSYQAEKSHKMERALLWKGALHAYSGKQVEERIEQVTGFPSGHQSDFIVDKLEVGSYWKPHYDVQEEAGVVPMATITIFLTEAGPPVVYPSCDEPVKIESRKGMGIVHHSTNNKHELDMATLHAYLPPSSGTVYVARKFVFATPVSNARRVALPLFAAPFGGKLPRIVVQLHDFMVEKFGYEQGGMYFDKLCIFVPVLVILGLAQAIATVVQSKMKAKKRKDKKN